MTKKIILLIFCISLIACNNVDVNDELEGNIIEVTNNTEQDYYYLIVNPSSDIKNPYDKHLNISYKFSIKPDETIIISETEYASLIQENKVIIYFWQLEVAVNQSNKYIAKNVWKMDLDIRDPNIIKLN